ncbi:MAG TPA: hypothetical protein VJO14_07955, partial [Bacteroidota bacterium]|nr:hypothetical protein [Bacteroidota bacterium]
MKLSSFFFALIILGFISAAPDLSASPQDQVYRTDARLEASTGIPRALYFQSKGPYKGTPEEKAREYLLEQVKTLRLTPGLPDLTTVNVAESPMGYHVTFQQTVNDLPVYRSDIVVTVNRGDRVVFTVNNYKPNLKIESPRPKFQAADAIQYARTYLKVTGKLIGEQSATLMVYAENPKKPRLAYRVIVPTEKPLGEWE